MADAPTTSAAPAPQAGFTTGGAQQAPLTPQAVGTPPGPGAQPGDVKAAAQEVARKLRIDDAEIDEAEVIKTYRERRQHQQAASKALNEGKALRKQSEELIAMLKDKNGLKQVLRKLGHDEFKLAEEILGAHFEEELMDPKDRELKTLKQKIAEREEQDRKMKEEIQRKHHEKRVEDLRGKYEKEFLDTLEKSKLPKTKQTVARMAGYIAQCAKIGYEITPAEAAQLLADDLKREHRSIAADADVESVIALYGEDFVNKIRKYDTSRVKTPEAALKTPVEQALEHHRERRTAKKRMSVREWQLHKRGLK